MALNNSSDEFNGLKEKPKSLEDLFQILYRRKYILLYSLLITMLLVLIFNIVSSPVYESTVSLKKEKPKENSSMQDIYQEMILLQTRDEIETEMQLASTREVMKKVVDELKLFMNIDKIVYPGGQKLAINQPFADYVHNYLMDTSTKKIMPQFNRINIVSADTDYQHFIKCIAVDSFQIFDTKSGKAIASSSEKSSDSVENISVDTGYAAAPSPAKVIKVFKFKLPQYTMEIKWQGAKPGSKVYYEITQYDKTVENLSKDISVDRIAKTDIFQIEAKATSPYMALLEANTMADKYREVRLEQQKMTIRSAFNFADNQIKDVQNKLLKAEQELSAYKSKANIASLSDNAKEMIDFLGNLEAEKVKTGLDMAEYEKRVAQMQEEMKDNEFIDQTYLTPEKTDRTDSPFSILQKQLADLEMQRIHLLEKKKSSHPDVIMIENQIKQAKEKLAKYNQSTLTAYRIIINSEKKKYDDLSDLSEKYNMKLKQLPGQESKLAELKRNRDVFEKMFVALLDKREEMRMAELSKIQDILVVEAAALPLKPVFPNKLLNYAGGILFGLIAGIFTIFILEFIKRRKIHLDNIENDLSFPLLAIIPKYSRQMERKIKEKKAFYDQFVVMSKADDGFNDGIKEAFRVLRTKLYHALDNKNKMVLFTSCEENTGKTSVISNLAISMASSGKRILLVDLDLRRATLTKNFGIQENTPGTIHFLNETLVYPNIYCPANTMMSENLPPTLDILPSGGTSESSSELLASERMTKLFNLIHSSKYDYVLVDTPPVTRVTDVLIIGKTVKNVVLLIKPEHTYKDSVKWGIKEMQLIDMNIIGSVANASVIEISSYRYGYGYGYGYSGKYSANKSSSSAQGDIDVKGKMGEAG